MRRVNYRLFGAGLLVGLSLACTRAETDLPMTGRDLFHASMEQPTEAGTKVYADEDLMLLWHADDRVSIFDKYTFNQEYRFTGETGDNAGSFEKVPNGGFIVGNEIPGVYAVYPYLSSTSLSNQGVLTVVLPSEQTYAVRSFGRGSNTMVSSTDDNDLLFKNLGGYLVLKLYGEGSVSSITLKGNGRELLAGKAEVTAPVGGNPTLAFLPGEAFQEVTLTCPEPVTLSASADDYTEFWFVLPPVVFQGGFSVTVTGPAGDSVEKSTGKAISIERNNLIRMAPFEVTLSDMLPVISVADVQGSDNGMRVRTEGLVTAVSTRAFILSDGDSHILVYTGPGNMLYSLGDGVQVTGYKATYQGVAEIMGPDLAVRVQSSDNPLPPLPYRDITGEFDSFTSGVQVPICFTGILTKSGSYYYVSVDGCARSGDLYWPLTGAVDESLLGKTVLVSGFYEGLHWYSGTEFLDIVMTEMRDGTPPDNEIWYYSTDGKVLEPLNAEIVDANIISNTYENGKGIIRFDRSVTRIGEEKNGYSSIGDCFFDNDSNLSRISFPNSLKSIATFAFLDCVNLVSVDLPDSLDYLGKDSFVFCGLKTVTVPPTEKMTGNPFSQCFSLTCISGPYATEDGLLLIKDGVCLSFAPAGHERCRIREDVIVIGSNAFVYCEDLKEVILPSGLKEIRQNAFTGCSSLESIDFPESLETLFSSSFPKSGLREITLPESLKSLCVNAFDNCPNLVSVTVKGAIESIDGNPFNGCSQLAAFHGEYSADNNRAFVKDDVLISIAPAGIQEYGIPSGVIGIGRNAFRDCVLEKVLVPSTVQRVGPGSFSSCPAMKSVVMLAQTPPAGEYLMFDNSNRFPIYVPSRSVDAYKSAPFWRDYADRIFPMDDTVSGGTEGTSIEIWD
jgi:hypothetical protein